MKSTIFGLLVMSFIIAGCGKDSGGGSTAYNMNYSNLTQPGQDAAKNFEAWYVSATEATTYPGNYYLTKSTSSAPDCEQKWYGLKCESSNVTKTSCMTTVNVSASSLKGQNPILAGLYNNTLGTLVNAAQSGSMYAFSIQKANGYVVTYTIDTQLPSAFQPIQVADYETQKSTAVTSYSTVKPSSSSITYSGLCF